MEEVIIKQMTGYSELEKATIEKEIKIHTKLMQPEDSSEYFCQLIDYTKHGASYYLVLKKYDGNLENYIESKGSRLKAKEALSIYNLILKAVLKMH